ncbi:hypothetical protein BDC45DRAFT_540859 [Circinella umbellata]|nr:hypothetical protein BDC45DRAFT_540859 [Circinella umbellata]
MSEDEYTYEDDDVENNNNLIQLWGMQTQSKEWEDVTAKDIFRFITLTIMDFWGMSSRNNFEKKHERSFWMESVVPIFKYMSVMNNLIVFSWCESLIVPGFWKNTTKKLFADGLGQNNDCDIIVMESSSGYSKENINHSMEDTWKLILMMTDSLCNELMKYQGAKFTDAQELATFGIQCICDQITLIKATMFDARRWQIIELQSAKIPITWDDRSNYMQVFELIATLHWRHTYKVVMQHRQLSGLKLRLSVIQYSDSTSSISSYISHSTNCNIDVSASLMAGMPKLMILHHDHVLAFTVLINKCYERNLTIIPK